MADFSSFFPAAGGGGGGGFNKVKKYSSLNAGADADVRQGGTSVIRTHPTQRSGSSLASGSTRITFYTEGWASTLSAALLVGTTFEYNSQTHTVTSRDNNDSGRLNVSFTPALTGGIPGNYAVTFTSAAAITVNPANDLGLTDGSYLGYFMVGGGATGGNSGSGVTGEGGYGGKILQSSALISTASTNLVLTVGLGGGKQSNNYSLVSSFTYAETQSTITGGLTLTTASGSRAQGTPGSQGAGSTLNFRQSGHNGINGYGIGGGPMQSGNYSVVGSDYHGFGAGGGSVMYSQPGIVNFYSGDGAILLYY
jgi:hypothetical protein